MRTGRYMPIQPQHLRDVAPSQPVGVALNDVTLLVHIIAHNVSDGYITHIVACTSSLWLTLSTEEFSVLLLLHCLCS